MEDVITMTTMMMEVGVVVVVEVVMGRVGRIGQGRRGMGRRMVGVAVSPSRSSLLDPDIDK